MYFASLLPPSLRRFACAALAFLAISPAALLAQSTSPGDGYDPNVDGNVYAMATQADGRLIIAGGFASISGFPRGNMGRLNGDGTLDLGFSPNANGAINTVAIQPDGKIIIGGAFTTLQPDGTPSPIARSRIARLNVNGTVDTGFNPNIGGLPDVQVYALAVQSDGKILVGGTFTSVQPNGAATATARSRLLRLNTDGSLDTTFNPSPDNAVFAIAIQPSDLRILVGGTFTNIAGGARNRIARLSASGALDTTFDPNASGAVNALLVLPDGKIMVGGNFASLQPNGAAAASSHNDLAKLNTDGSLDTSYNAGANGQIWAFALQADGKLLVAGAFNILWPAEGTGQIESHPFAGRFNTDGSLETNFVPTPNRDVHAIVAQSDGGVILGGYFTQIKPLGATFGTPRNHLARIYADGSPDVALDLGSGGGILAAAAQSDGKLVIGGTFTTVGGTTRNYLARLNSDGTLDGAFIPAVNNNVSLITMQADGKILIAGSFSTVNGTARSFLARLNADGTLDTGFDPSPNNQVTGLAVQSDGKIILGGTFSALTPNGGTVTAATFIARVNSDGTFDTSYTVVLNNQVSAIKIQTDGKAIVAGAFTAVQPAGTTNQFARNSIMRLNADGTLDNGYNPNPNSGISTLALQADGKVIAVGSFTLVAPNGATSLTTRDRVARFNTDGTVDTTFNPDADSSVGAVAVQADGKVVLSGAFDKVGTHTISNFARVNSDGSPDATFEPNPNGRVLVILPQSDGRLIIAGTFSTLQPTSTGSAVPVGRIARLASGGTVDTTYAPAISGQAGAQVNTVVTQADGKLLIGGTFSGLGGTAGGSVARFAPDGRPDLTFSPSADGPVNTLVVRQDVGSVVTQGNGFAWINSDGTLRSGFSTDANSRFVGEVKVVARQLDGKIVIGGVFSNLSGTTGSNMARFNTDGSLDTSFNPGPNGTVSSIVVQADGKLLIGGAFSTIAGGTRNRIARLNLDGSLDTFDPNLGAQVDAILVQSDGKILVGGAFTTAQPNGTTAVSTRNFIARFNADGTVDTAFSPSPSAEVFSLALQSDGKIIIGGSFATVQGTGSTTATARLNLARLNSDGTVDDGFDPNKTVVSGPVLALVVQSNGMIVVGGSFTSLGGAAHSNIGRVNSDGSLDTTFAPDANGRINSLAVQTDGKILVGGFFTTIAGSARNFLARLSPSGSLDTSFDPNANNQIDMVALQTDGSILIGGSFSTLQPGGAIVVGGSFGNIGGAALKNLAVLNADGTANSTFKPDPNGAVNAALVQSDSKLVAGGAFTSIAGVARNRLARFNADGSFESAFNPDLNGTVLSLALQSDGKILVGGTFTTVTGTGRPGLARLNLDGTLDGAFNPAGGLGVNAMAVQSDGKILVVRSGSGVSSILSRLNADGSADGTFAVQSTASLVNSIVVQADGKVLVGGAFTTIAGAAHNRLARLNADGSNDATFSPDVDNTVNAIALQQDGKPVIGGTFGSVGGAPHVRVARIGNNTPATQSIPANSFTILTWNRGGSSPEVSAVTFESSTDSRNWRALGNATRVAGTANWRLTAPSTLPANTTFYVRARGVVPTTQGGSEGLVEQVSQLYIQPISVVTSAPEAMGSTDRAFLYATGATNNPASYSASGLPDGLSIDTTTGIISGTPHQTGVFNVTLSVTNGGGVSTARTLTLTINPGTGASGSSSGHLLDISCLAHVDAGNPLITGFVITGAESKSVLLRAIGPGLAILNVGGFLPAPRLQLYASDGHLLLDNSNWGGEASLAAVFAAVGEFPLSPSSADAAAAVTLAPGGYTVVVSDANGTANGGTVLSEIYDVAGGAQQFAAMSARGRIIAGGSLTSGFVITGDVPRRVLVRGIGPALAGLGVSDGLADPVVGVYDMQGHQLASNDNWQTPLAGGVSAAEVAAGAAAVGDYALADGSKDAALIVTLPPGTYTGQVTSANSSAGSSVIEIYELP